MVLPAFKLFELEQIKSSALVVLSVFSVFSKYFSFNFLQVAGPTLASCVNELAFWKVNTQVLVAVPKEPSTVKPQLDTVFSSLCSIFTCYPDAPLFKVLEQSSVSANVESVL